MVEFAAPLPPPPEEGAPPLEVFNYAVAQLNYMGLHSEVQDVYEEIGETSAEWFALALDAVEKASGYVLAPPQDRLAWYRSKPMTHEDALAPYQDLIAKNAMETEMALAEGKEPPMQQPIPEVFSWEEQMLKFPWDYERDWKDWTNLRERAERGDFGPQAQAEEIAWSQQAMVGMQI